MTDGCGTVGVRDGMCGIVGVRTAVEIIGVENVTEVTEEIVVRGEVEHVGIKRKAW